MFIIPKSAAETTTTMTRKTTAPAEDEKRVNTRYSVDIEVYVYVDGEYEESYDGLLEVSDALGVPIEKVKELIVSGDELDRDGKSITLDIAYDSPYDYRHITEDGKEKDVLFIQTSKVKRS